MGGVRKDVDRAHGSLLVLPTKPRYCWARSRRHQTFGTEPCSLSAAGGRSEHRSKVQPGFLWGARKELRGSVLVPVLGWSLSLQPHRERCVLLRAPEGSTLPGGFAPIAEGEVQRKRRLGMLQEKDPAVLSKWVRGSHVCSLALVHCPPCGGEIGERPGAWFLVFTSGMACQIEGRVLGSGPCLAMTSLVHASKQNSSVWPGACGSLLPGEAWCRAAGVLRGAVE